MQKAIEFGQRLLITEAYDSEAARSPHIDFLYWHGVFSTRYASKDGRALATEKAFERVSLERLESYALPA